MKFDYGTQLSPYPIELSIGALRKPKLRDIAEPPMSFERFNFYEVMLKMSPELYFTEIGKDSGGLEAWESFSDKEKEEFTLYKMILENEDLIQAYTEILDFFFVQKVVFKDGFFILLKNDTELNNDIANEEDVQNIRGVISENIFDDVLDSIQRICCINSTVDESELKFKNDLAKKMYQKMQKALKEQKKRDLDATIPNIISAVSSKHPSINPINVWELTIFQLLDAFNRTRTSAIYEIDSVRVSVWGDTKNTFKPNLWYKNDYDRN